MNDLLRRRRAMMEKKSDVLDTSPPIAEYGKYLWHDDDAGRDDPTSCYTEWINIDPVSSTDRSVILNYGGLSTNVYMSMFQFRMSDGKRNYWYYGTKEISKLTTSIRFTLVTANLRSTYAFVENTGQILFAGKDTIYYGHRNISEIT